MVVYSLMSAAPSNLFYQFNSTLAAITAAIVVLLTVIAVVIDRRALLVSALIYLGAVIAYAITRTAGEDTGVFFATLLILGVTVLALGVGWRPLRRTLIGLFPAALANRLPPVVVAA
jgi:hypothetical protein